MTTRTRAVRRAAAATVTVLALGGLSACGDDSSTASDEPSASAETSAAESSSAEPDGEESIDPAAFVDDVLGSMTDLTTAHMSMSMEGGPAAMTMEGDVDYTTTPPNMSMKMSNEMLGQGEMEVRMVDGVMYMQMPQLGNGKWLKMDLNGKGSPFGEGLVEQMDPSASLEMMKDAVTEVTDLGEEEVDGETLEHYEMTVRSKEIRDLQDQLGSGLGAAGGGVDLPTIITYDIWTDEDDMIRQSTIAMGDLGSVTVKLSAWGEPVEIEAPPASDVMKMPDGMSLSS